MEEIVLSCFQDITGLDAEEFKEYSDVHLLEEGIIDSLCLVALFEMLSKKLNVELTVNDFIRDDFDGVNKFIAKVEILCKSRRA